MFKTMSSTNDLAFEYAPHTFWIPFVRGSGMDFFSPRRIEIFLLNND